MGRRPCCEKVGLKRGEWSALEDQILSNYVKTHGEGKWRDLPQKAGLKRCGKSCRLRWFNYLNPKIIRGNITQEEEDLIMTLQKRVGNRWSLIAGRLPGRTDNEIKNYWNTILCRKVHGGGVAPRRRPRKRPNKTKLSSDNLAETNNLSGLISSESADVVANPQQPATSQESGEIMQDMVNGEASQIHVYGKTEFRGHVYNGPQAPLGDRDSTQHQSGSNRENDLGSMGDRMQNAVNTDIPHSHVYENCYHDLMSALLTEEISIPAVDEYSMQTYQDILSEVIFTLDDSMFEHWMTNAYPEKSDTSDLGSLALATLFEWPHWP